MSNLLAQVALGSLLVSIVVFVFLRRVLPTLIIVLTIILAILIGALGFAFTGQTINVMTLGGIALAIGTVVDAGIVVVENVIRHQRMGKTMLDAARDGTQEVSGAILAGTLTTLAVFLPAVFLTGMIKYLFTPLSMAATFTIGASYILALTVVPAFCATFVRNRVGRDQTAPRYARRYRCKTQRPLRSIPGHCLEGSRDQLNPDCRMCRRIVFALAKNRIRTLPGSRRRHFRVEAENSSGYRIGRNRKARRED